MAENSRGQNRNGQRSRNNGPTRAQEEKVSNKRNNSSRGLRDTDLDRIRENNRIPKNSGLSDKRFITGSDYDGQLSDE